MAGLVGQLLGQYRILEQVGQGGMATVYRALDTRTLQEVAVKVLSATIVGDRRFLRRFRREGEVVSRLKHPNIVPVLAYGEARGYAYLVMPFVRGESLHGYITEGKVTPESSARWIGQVASALDYAHRQGVIHRDVKPSNILIDAQGNALLTDFGLARLVEGTGTLTGSLLMGTPAYVAPEQGQGLKIDGRADEYSLGVILYQIATGTLPFEGDTPMATVLMHIQEPVPRPRRFNPDLSPAVEAVILKSLAKKPSERFPSVAALNRAYQAALAGQPVPGLDLLPSALPPEMATLPLDRSERLVFTERSGPPRRKAGWVLGLTLALVLLLAGFFAYPSLRALVQPPTPPTVMPASTASLPGPWAPSPTPAPAPTPTAVVSQDCPGLSLINFQRQGSDVAWTLDNSTGAPVRIVDFRFEGLEGNVWPLAVFLGGQPLAELPAEATPGTEIEIRLSPEQTTLAPGSLTEFRLHYAWETPVGGLYAVDVVLESGCVLTARW